MINERPPIDFSGPSCPLPLRDYPKVLMAHGGGGHLMARLITDVFMSAFDNPLLKQQLDSVTLSLDRPRFAFTTDSYVIHPLFFPGGDIGSMAVFGTVNDLAMSGARPLYLSTGFIIEEGLSMETLWRIVCSMRAAADEADVQIVTGDTKVVDRGKGDGVFINVAGIGAIEHDLDIAPTSVCAGDRILLNGDIGRHGIAVMAVREGLEFDTEIESDSAPVHRAALAMLKAGVHPRCMRDLTRGGLVSAMNELSFAGQFGVQIVETAVPVRDDVRAACEMLGFDPMYVANEGRFVVFVSPNESERALDTLRQHAPTGAVPTEIGVVTEANPGVVTMRSRIGSTRILDRLSGEQLPRIC